MSNAGEVWKNRDSQRISGRPLGSCVWSTFERSSIAYSTWTSTVTRYKQTPPSHSSVNLVYDRKCWKITQKITQNCNIFLLIMYSLWHTATTCLACLESSRRDDVLSPNWHVTRTPPAYRFRDIRGQIARKPTPSPFLVSHLVTPKDVTTKRGRPTCPDDWSTVPCKTSRGPVAEISVPPSPSLSPSHTYLRLTVRQNAIGCQIIGGGDSLQ